MDWRVERAIIASNGLFFFQRAWISRMTALLPSRPTHPCTDNWFSTSGSTSAPVRLKLGKRRKRKPLASHPGPTTSALLRLKLEKRRKRKSLASHPDPTTSALLRLKLGKRRKRKPLASHPGPTTSALLRLKLGKRRKRKSFTPWPNNAVAYPWFPTWLRTNLTNFSKNKNYM